MILKYSKETIYSRIGLILFENQVLDGEYYKLANLEKKHCYKRVGNGYIFKGSMNIWDEPALPGETRYNFFRLLTDSKTKVRIVEPE